MHALPFLILVYIVFGLVFYVLMGGPLSKEKDLGRTGAIMLSVFWPLALIQFDTWMRWGKPPPWRSDPNNDSTGRFGGPTAYKQQGWENDPSAHPNRPSPHENIPKANYNQLVFGDDDPKGAEEEIDDDDVEAFIREQFGHQSAPLAEATTISYKRTGVSKTYPAGTIFPDAFLADWKAGFFSTAQ
jgi:hypothetical protein